MEWWTVDLLDGDDKKLGELRTVKDFSLEWSIFRSVQGSGSMTLDEDPHGVVPNWLVDRVKIWHHNDSVSRPFGVWLVQRPKRDYGPVGVVKNELGLLDKTQLLNQPVGRHWTAFDGSMVMDLVASIVFARGFPVIYRTETNAVLRQPMTWEPDDTWLKICNDLLETIGYTPLETDMDGGIGTWPYVDPESRPLVQTYGPNSADLRMWPEFEDEADTSEVPNVVWITSDGDEDEPGLVGYAENKSGSDPFSTVNRPEVVFTEHVQSVADQGAIDSLALRRLSERSQVTRRATLTHPVDGVALQEVVEHGLAGFKGPVVERKVKMGVGAVVEDVVRRLYTEGDHPWL